jgi:hypothetical protein
VWVPIVTNCREEVFLEIGFPGVVDVQVELVVPIFRDGEGKRVAQVAVENIREALVGAELATGTEVDSVVAELEAFAEDERTLMSIAPTFQVWGQKALA